MVAILFFAALLLVLAITILLRNLPLHWRAALLAGIIALWFWGMAFAVSHYIKFSHIFRHAVGDPAAAAQALADCLTISSAVNSVTVPLLILCSIIFMIHRPRTVPAPATPPAIL